MAASVLTPLLTAEILMIKVYMLMWHWILLRADKQLKWSDRLKKF